MTSPQDFQSPSPHALPVPDAAVRQPLPVPATTVEHAPPGSSTAEPTAQAPADIDKRIAFAESTHQYIREYIRLADQKAGFFFTVSTALLAFLYRANASARWLKPVLQWNVIDTAAFLGMAALALSAVLSLIVVIPRTPGSRRGILFWEAIAEFDTSRQYADDVTSLSLPSLLQTKVEHCHDLARVCRRKYSMLRAALWIGTVGLAATVVLFLFASSPWGA